MQPLLNRLWLCAVMAALPLLSCNPQAGASAPRSLRDLGDVKELEAAFNQEHGKPRLILLMSPT